MDISDKYISGKIINKIGKKYGDEKIGKIFNKNCYYNYNDFNKILINNIDGQVGGGIKNIVRDLFLGILNHSQNNNDPKINEFKKSILDDSLSDVKIAYNDLKTTIYNRFKPPHM